MFQKIFIVCFLLISLGFGGFMVFKMNKPNIITGVGEGEGKGIAEKQTDPKKQKEIDQIKNRLEDIVECQTDDDCEFIEGKCPFGCYIPLNHKYRKSMQSTIDAYLPDCFYQCRLERGVACVENKCQMVF